MKDRIYTVTQNQLQQIYDLHIGHCSRWVPYVLWILTSWAVVSAFAKRVKWRHRARSGALWEKLLTISNKEFQHWRQACHLNKRYQITWKPSLFRCKNFPAYRPLHCHTCISRSNHGHETSAWRLDTVEIVTDFDCPDFVRIYQVKLWKLLHSTRHFRYCCFRAIWIE